MSSVLEKELNECRAFATRGFELAENNYKDIKTILRDVDEKLKQANQQQNNLSRFENIDLMNKQRLQLNDLDSEIDSI